jgi:hypothetical protein
VAQEGADGGRWEEGRGRNEEEGGMEGEGSFFGGRRGKEVSREGVGGRREEKGGSSAGRGTGKGTVGCERAGGAA